MQTLLEYGLLACFVALLLTPFGLPIPEDVSLFAAGALAGAGHTELPLALAVGYAGVLLGDMISYSFGRRIGLEPRGRMGRLIGRSQIQRIERFYARYGTATIAIARQLPGMRLPAFFFAGATGVPFARFLLIDGLAALVTVGVFVPLGYWFSDDIGRIVPWLDRFRFVLLLIAVAVAAVLFWRTLRRWREQEDDPTPS